jgi:hypothetical protein
MNHTGRREKRKPTLQNYRTWAALVLLLIAVFGSSAAKASNKNAKQAVPATVYVTKPGDTLYVIASRYLLAPRNWVALMRFNRLQSHRLQPGAQLQVPVALLKQQSLAAHVIATSGPAERAFGDGPFTPLRVDMALSEGDRVRTGDHGFVTLETQDGSHISVPPSSMIKISALQQTVLTGAIDRTIELLRGEVDSVVIHATKKDDRFQIRSPSVIAGVRGTHFRVAYNPDLQTTAVEVLDGTVAVIPAPDGPLRSAGEEVKAANALTQADEQLVNARFGSITANSGKVGDPIALLGAPTLIAPGKVQAEKTVSFDVVPLPEARAYRLQIARDAGLLDLVDDTRVTGSHAVFDALADDTYFVRVSAIDRNGLEGLPRTYGFERRQLGLATSANRRADTNDYVFRWLVSRTSVTTRFRFVLAATPNLENPIIDQVDIQGGQLEIVNLPPGEYYWNVIAEQFENGKLYQKAGAVSSFTLAQ